MNEDLINGDMKVWDVIHQHPETIEVFQKYGCPDMRKGIFALSAHIMKINWAAKIHHIDSGKLLQELNRVVQKAPTGSEKGPSLH